MKTVGNHVGDAVGVLVGAKVGVAVGALVGAAVGDSVGDSVGATVGCPVTAINDDRTRKKLKKDFIINCSSVSQGVLRLMTRVARE